MVGIRVCSDVFVFTKQIKLEIVIEFGATPLYSLILFIADNLTTFLTIQLKYLL